MGRLLEFAGRVGVGGGCGDRGSFGEPELPPDPRCLRLAVVGDTPPHVRQLTGGFQHKFVVLCRNPKDNFVDELLKFTLLRSRGALGIGVIALGGR